MTKLQRVNNVFVALLMILGVVFIILMDKGYYFVVLILWVSLAIAAVRGLIYYFTMARHMTGGKLVLYRAIILSDFAIFSFLIMDISKVYILVYLSVLFGFSGLVDILRSLEAKKQEAFWHFNMFQGVVSMSLAILCLIFISSVRLMEIVYCVSLVNAAVLRLISAFRATEIVYIP